MSLEILIALVRQLKGVNLSASVYFYAKWNPAACAPYMVWGPLSKRVLRHCCLLLTSAVLWYSFLFLFVAP